MKVAMIKNTIKNIRAEFNEMIREKITKIINKSGLFKLTHKVTRYDLSNKSYKDRFKDNIRRILDIEKKYRCTSYSDIKTMNGILIEADNCLSNDEWMKNYNRKKEISSYEKMKDLYNNILILDSLDLKLSVESCSSLLTTLNFISDKDAELTPETIDIFEEKIKDLKDGKAKLVAKRILNKNKDYYYEEEEIEIEIDVDDYVNENDIYEDKIEYEDSILDEYLEAEEEKEIYEDVKVEIDPLEVYEDSILYEYEPMDKTAGTTPIYTMPF